MSRMDMPVPITGSTDAAVPLDNLVHAAEGRLTHGLSPTALGLAWQDWATHLANSPFRRLALARDALHQARHFAEVALTGTRAVVASPGDHRFAAPGWEHPPFLLAEQAFLLAQQWWEQAAAGAEGTGRANARIVGFMARQWLDMLSPSNLPWMNPEVIAATVESGGRNLLAGSANALHDLHRLLSGRPEGAAFRVGHDIAATKGKVVLRNRLIELIQYSPAPATVRPEPVLIVPAWIMKYYILDLSAQNSLIRWLVAQGYTVFAISWHNPTEADRDLSLEDYRERGVMAAIAAALTITGAPRLHATGYCLGGTLLAIAAAAMGRAGDDRLASVSLFAAQTDFTEPGELGLFIDESEVSLLEAQMSQAGYLTAQQMAGAFQMLRSYDLLWSRMVGEYLMGTRPPMNDLMAWNADATRMPARMHSEYLRRLFLHNDLAEGRFPVDGRPVALSDITLPVFVVGTQTDHVAPWRSVYKLHYLTVADLTFVLTSGGHNAGIVSEPGHPHRSYQLLHRREGAAYIGPDDWLQQAPTRDGSWWPAWLQWLGERSGEPGEPPPMGNAQAGYRPLAAAPGHYVKET